MKYELYMQNLLHGFQDSFVSEWCQCDIGPRESSKDVLCTQYANSDTQYNVLQAIITHYLSCVTSHYLKCSVHIYDENPKFKSWDPQHGVLRFQFNEENFVIDGKLVPPTNILNITFTLLPRVVLHYYDPVTGKVQYSILSGKGTSELIYTQTHSLLDLIVS